MGESGKIALRPSYWASVSGGKDSLYMLNYILHNLDRYPLDGVVHFELEIDYPFIHDVIGTRKARWCNSAYKLDAKRQLSEWLESVGYYVVQYIGYCADEEYRYSKRLSAQKVERYPLVENGITEDAIWEWAKKQAIYNHYYVYNKRCGCMYCPISSYRNYAYLYKYYPDRFAYMIEKMRETEKIREAELGRPFSVISSNPKYNADYLEEIIKTNGLKKLEEHNEQM